MVPRSVSTIPDPIAVEARAKLMWGESPAKVKAYLEEKKVGPAESEALIESILAENAEATRRTCWIRIVMGTLLMLAPLAYYMVTRLVGFIQLKLFAALIVLGVIGIARATNGLSMVLRPRKVTYSLADQF